MDLNNTEKSNIYQAIQSNFKFISDSEDISELLNKSFKNYRVIKFYFEIITPKSGIRINRELNYITTVRQDWTSIKKTLTLLVLKHTPKWYYKYINSFPVKVTKLEIKPIKRTGQKGKNG